MEEEMEIEPVFEVREIDLDYEFDAVGWFDLKRAESPAEAREAELWFESAKSYPPSPFVAKLFLREDVSLGNIKTSPESKDGQETTALLNDGNVRGLSAEFSHRDGSNRDCGMHRGIFTNLQSGNLQKVLNQPAESSRGLTCISNIPHNKLNGKSKSGAKTFLTRSSTLMKPTASQLAKQNHSRMLQKIKFSPISCVTKKSGKHTLGASLRFQTLLAQNGERSLCNSSTAESQAAKRQKLEGGVLCKVADAKQQVTFVHKVPKKDVTVDKTSMLARMKITVPREPDLETAQRSHRIRSKDATELVSLPPAARRFKARPLNRKILEAPSLPLPKKSTPRLPEFQEFHLKTSERAMQHSSAVSSSSLNAFDKGSERPSNTSVVDKGSRENRRPTAVDASHQDSCYVKYNFKARPLNKKILTSKGDIGIFRNSKRETTVPEFNFHTEKRVNQNLPIDLFSKLSLTSQVQPNNGPQLKLSRPACISMKGSKENILNSFQAGHEVTSEKETQGGNRINVGNDNAGVGAQWSARRSLGIR
ncbi:protein TPX2-like isoform X2 [Carica papaya]|uniref:protein TPX2-like isoform X2 n=1 Tax=Carica papaya TaxID=3649 RepID=UPI000B8CD9CC|nr:protein TPX2-like isoform X2 [Carica papaya]